MKGYLLSLDPCPAPPRIPAPNPRPSSLAVALLGALCPKATDLQVQITSPRDQLPLFALLQQSTHSCPLSAPSPVKP